MPNPIQVPLTPPRVPVLDERTGTISREWYMFFLSLRQGIGSSSVSLDDLQKGPPAVSVDEINENINTKTADLAPSNEALYSLVAELTKQIEALAVQSCTCNNAELQKQLDSLALTPQPQLGTISPLNKDYIDWLGFNKTAGYAVLPGQIAWNSADGCLDIGMGYDGVVLQTGMEMLYRIKASSAITDGQLVMFDGAVGASGVLKGKPSITSLTSGQLIMGVATMNMATNDFGYVTAFGLVRGIDTTGSSVGETWHDGDVLYYNPAYVGSMTNVQPAAPNEKVIVAAVVNAGSGGSGSLFIRPTFLPNLSDLSDVNTTGAVANDLIQYNGTYWTNVTPASVISGAGGAPVTKTADFTVAAGETWLINNKAGSTCTVTLPTASANTGRTLHFQNYQAYTLVSASSNVVPLVGGAAGTAILAAVAGDTCTLVSNGTNWVMTQYVPNNVLLLE